MTLSALELSDSECAELLKQLAGPGSQTEKWYTVVRKAFALGVERASPSDGLAETLVEPLIDIAATVAQAELALPAEESGNRYGLYRVWAQEFEKTSRAASTPARHPGKRTSRTSRTSRSRRRRPAASC